VKILHLQPGSGYLTDCITSVGKYCFPGYSAAIVCNKSDRQCNVSHFGKTCQGVADLRLAVASRPCSPKKKGCGNEPDLAKRKG